MIVIICSLQIIVSANVNGNQRPICFAASNYRVRIDCCWPGCRKFIELVYDCVYRVNKLCDIIILVFQFRGDGGQAQAYH